MSSLLHTRFIASCHHATKFTTHPSRQPVSMFNCSWWIQDHVRSSKLIFTPILKFPENKDGSQVLAMHLGPALVLLCLLSLSRPSVSKALFSHKAFGSQSIVSGGMVLLDDMRNRSHWLCTSNQYRTQAVPEVAGCCLLVCQSRHVAYHGCACVCNQPHCRQYMCASVCEQYEQRTA